MTDAAAKSEVGKPIPDFKVWGDTRCISVGHGFEVHALNIDPLTVCSCHRHSTKWNLFYVVAGSVAVHLYADGNQGGQPVETVKLTEGHTLQIPPGRWHRFEGLETSKVIEVYWTDPVNQGDIERFDVGRKIQP